MAYPDSVVVSARGELLVGLSDGQIINAGKVVGPEGVRGASGLPGLRGEPGRDGISCIAAFKAPTQDDGAEGWSIRFKERASASGSKGGDTYWNWKTPDGQVVRSAQKSCFSFAQKAYLVQ